MRHSHSLSGFFLIYTWPPKLAVLLAPVLASPSNGKESNSRNKKVSRRTKHTCQRENSRQGLLVCLGVAASNISCFLAVLMASWCGEEQHPACEEEGETDEDERGSDSTEEEEKSSRTQDFSPSPVTFYTFSTLAPVPGFSVHQGFTARLSLLPGEEKHAGAQRPRRSVATSERLSHFCPGRCFSDHRWKRASGVLLLCKFKAFSSFKSCAEG